MGQGGGARYRRRGIRRPVVIPFSFFLWNVRSLGGSNDEIVRAKLEYILEQTRNYTFVVICETQFKQHAYLHQSGCVVGVSRQPRNPKNRGLVVLAPPHVAAQCSVLHQTELTVTISFHSHTLSFFYLPPSLPLPLVCSEFSLPPHIPPPSLVLGDFNVSITRFFGSFPSVGVLRPTRGSDGTRADLLARMIRSFNMRLPSIHEPHNTDWGASIWSSTQLKHALPDALAHSSDHAPIIFSPLVQLSLLTPSPCKRLRIPRLKSEYGIQDVQAMYSTLHPHLLSMLAKTASLPPPHCLLNECYEFIVGTFMDIGAYAGLGFVHYPDARAGINHSPRSLGEQLSHQESLRRLKSMHRFGPSIHVTGGQTGDPLTDADRYFSSLFHEPQDSVGPVPWPNPNHLPFSYVANWFDCDAVWAVVSSYPSGKSCGPDGLPSSFLKILIPTYPQKEEHRKAKPPLAVLLSTLFQWIVRTHTVPSAWLSTLVCPVKKKVEVGTIEEFRPITLTQVLRRIFEACLLRMFSMDPVVSRLLSLSPLQAGFRNNHSCYLQILTLHDSCQAGASHFGFVDWKNAYDTVSLPLLWRKLAQRGLPACVGLLLQALFDHTNGRAVIHGCLSPGFARTRGLLQGSLLSPLLFNIFIDDLADQLTKFVDPECPVPPALLYADDICLLARTPRRLQQLFNIVTRWGVENHMRANVTKSGVVVPRGSPVPPAFFLFDIMVPFVSTYKYLGVPVNDSGIMFFHMVRERVASARRKLNLFRLNHFRDTPLHPQHRLVFIRTFILPTCEYGLPLLATLHTNDITECIEPLVEFVSSDISAFLGKDCGKNPSTSVILSMYGITSMCSRIQHLALKFHLHLGKLASRYSSHPLFSLPPLPPHAPHDYLFPSYSTLPIVKEYGEWCAKSIEERELTDASSSLDGLSPLDRFLYNYRLHHLSLYADGTQLLPQYMVDTNRIGKSLVDGLVYSLPRKHSILAIQWRCNKFKVAKFYCPYINPLHPTRRHQFKRTCVNPSKCNLLDGVLSPHHTVLVRRFTRLCLQGDYPAKITMLDYLLNQSEYDAFKLCILWLEDNVTETY